MTLRRTKLENVFIAIKCISNNKITCSLSAKEATHTGTELPILNALAPGKQSINHHPPSHGMQHIIMTL